VLSLRRSGEGGGPIRAPRADQTWVGEGAVGSGAVAACCSSGIEGNAVGVLGWRGCGGGDGAVPGRRLARSPARDRVPVGVAVSAHWGRHGDGV